VNNLEKYKKCFVVAFELQEGADVESMNYQSVPEWDSIGHMALMDMLENDFNISLESDDIIDFSSFSAGMKILEKYNVDFSK
jgi:acyl carrier protein